MDESFSTKFSRNVSVYSFSLGLPKAFHNIDNELYESKVDTSHGFKVM